MRKRIFAMLVALIMAISLLPVSALAATAEIVYNDADDALAATGVAATKTVTANDDGTYTITLSVTGKTGTETSTQILPADVVLVVDTSTSMDDTVSRTTCGGTVSWRSDWLNSGWYCEACGTQYGIPPWDRTCDVVTQRTNRLDVAKSAAHQFVTGLLAASNYIHIGLYDFSGSNRTNLGLTSNETTLHDAIDALHMPNRGDGTDYDLGLTGAENILASSESERAKFIVFLSDGEPTKGNGVGTADQLKGSGVTIFTVGIDVDNNAAKALRAISSRTPTDGYYYYTASSSGSSGTALNDVLAQIQKEIESKIPAGTNAVMTDFINTDSFEYVSADSGLTYNDADGRLTWNIGNLTNETQTVKFTVRLKDVNTEVGQLPTNENVELTFTAPNGDFVRFTEDAIGKPKVGVYKVTYTDGVVSEEVFADKVSYNLRSGEATPAFGAAPEREGYEFTGWNPRVADTISGSEYNIVYTAQWEKCEAPTTYTVSYSVSGDVPADYTAPANASVAHGADYTVAAVPALQEGTKDGVSGTYSFDGWYDGQNKVTALTNVTESKTLTGYWTFTKTELTPITVYLGSDEGEYQWVMKNLTGSLPKNFKETFTVTLTPAFEVIEVNLDAPVAYAVNETAEVLPHITGTVTMTDNGKAAFDFDEPLTFNTVGEYKFTVKEEAGDTKRMKYDGKEYTLIVSVTEDHTKGLVAAAEPVTVTNQYTNPTPYNPPVAPKLNKADHYAYVVGYPDGTVQPQGAITRAEVATIFFRLLSDETRDLYWTKDNGYTDVKAGDWFNNAVSTLSNAGIINGYPDGTFRPNAPITRAEMAKVIAMFAELNKDSEGFKDIAGHWAEAYIKLAAGNGWIAGYPDGTFRPDQYITRAETMTMINRVLERVPSTEKHLLAYEVMLTFPDNQPGDWYYIAVQEATNSHTYERYATEKNGDEQWIKLIDNYDWTKLEF